MPQATQADSNHIDAQEKQRAAKQKIVNLLRTYPRDTPPEHTIFGYGGVRITFGDLLDAFGVAHP